MREVVAHGFGTAGAAERDCNEKHYEYCFTLRSVVRYGMARVYFNVLCVLFCVMIGACAVTTDAIPGGRSLDQVADVFDSVPSGALPDQDPRAVNLTWWAPSACHFFSAQVTEPSTGAKYALVKAQWKWSSLHLRPGHYSLQVECVDTKTVVHRAHILQEVTDSASARRAAGR